MLKSLSTQFVATLFFGPLGLAYSSVAAAVFLSLILAVLYFTELSILAVFIIWPVAIITGLLIVKLHNDQIRSSGGSLLLSPDAEDGPAVSTFNSWGRGVAVLSMLAVGGYLAYWYNSERGNTADVNSVSVAGMKSTDAALLGSSESVDLAGSGSGITRNSDWIESSADQSTGSSELAIAKTYPMEDIEVIPSSGSTTQSDGGFDVSSDAVMIGTSSQTETLTGNVVYVSAEMVNLRQGPGTNYTILDQVERGDELAEVERAGSWIRVVATESGASGWIFSRLVSSQR